MLWQAEVSKGPGGSSWGGSSLGDAVLKWERRGNKVYLWKVAFRKRAEGAAVKTAVDAASTDSIIAVFPVEAEGKNKSAVILVTNLFIARAARSVDQSRRRRGGSIEREPFLYRRRQGLSHQCRRRNAAHVLGRRRLRTPGPFGGGGGGGGSKTAVVHQSLVMLPEKTHARRYFDPRVGLLHESFESYDSPSPGPHPPFSVP